MNPKFSARNRSNFCLLLFVCCLLPAAAYANDTVIGNFETGLDSWAVEEGTSGDITTSTTGFTLGSHSLSVLVAPGQFWKIRRDGTLNLVGAVRISMDVTFIASEWPSEAWLNINKMALKDHTVWSWQEVLLADMSVTKISGADVPTPDTEGNVVYWTPSMGDATWTVSWDLTDITKSNDTYSFYVSLQQPSIASGSAGRFYIDNIRVASTAQETITVIGNWENDSSYDGWSDAWEGSPVLAPGNTNGVTLGSGALSVTTTGGFWCLQWDGSPRNLAGTTLKFDLTMLASEWPSQPTTQVAYKIALNSDGASGWKEYENLTTATNMADDTSANLYWDASEGDASKTYSLDISDYDTTGATWLQINISIEGGDGAGHFYFDNARLVTTTTEQPQRLHVESNKIKNEDGDNVVLRGVALIDAGQQQQWKGGITAMIDRLTDEDDINCDSVGWRTNVIRIPVFPPDTHEDIWPYEFDPESSDLYNLLRTTVDYCASKDVYAIIEWHDIDDMTEERIDVAQEFWAYMAQRFADDTHVMFELFNEPINSTGTDEENWAVVKTGMEELIETVREYAPHTLLFIGTPRYCQIIGPTADNPVDDPNVVYVSHIYPYHWNTGYLYYTSSITAAAEEHPVIMGEWGFIENDTGILDGTITSYGDPLREFVEGLGIGSIAWVAGYDWNPPIYNYDSDTHIWTLLEGEGYMGCFLKDWLYDGWIIAQDTTIDLTISRCQVTAGATRGHDTIEVSGTMASLPSLLGFSHIDVNIVSGVDGNDIYTEDVNFAQDTTNNRFIWSTSRTGQINLLMLNFTNSTFVLRAEDVDLTGLGAPVHLDLTLGDYILSGDANETIINGSSSIPPELMAGYENSLDVELGSVSDSTASLQDNFYCIGNITSRYASSTNLANQAVVITWANEDETVTQNFTLLAGSFTRVSGNSYQCNNVLAPEGARVTATINLDACTFTVLVQKTNLSVTSGIVKFGISFTGFNQTDEITNLQVTKPSVIRYLRR